MHINVFKMSVNQKFTSNTMLFFYQIKSRLNVGEMLVSFCFIFVCVMLFLYRDRLSDCVYSVKLYISVPLQIKIYTLSTLYLPCIYFSNVYMPIYLNIKKRSYICL